MDESLKPRIITALQTLARTARSPEDAVEAHALLALIDPAEPEPAPTENPMAVEVQMQAKESAEKVIEREFGTTGAVPSRSAHLDVDGDVPFVPEAMPAEPAEAKKKGKR